MNNRLNHLLALRTLRTMTISPKHILTRRYMHAPITRGHVRLRHARLCSSHPTGDSHFAGVVDGYRGVKTAAEAGDTPPHRPLTMNNDNHLREPRNISVEAPMAERTGCVAAVGSAGWEI